MTARRAEQTRRMANRTHTKTVYKLHAAQRLAISRVRHNGTGILDRESVDMLPSVKIALVEHVGCMAVLDGFGIDLRFATARLLLLHSSSYLPR